MSTDYEIDHDGQCPKCGHSPVHYRDCINWCEEGYFDESDEDFLLPGSSMVKCPECRGTGVETWCPHCGENLSGVKIHEDEEYE
jgi:hypothetical protein